MTSNFAPFFKIQPGYSCLLDNDFLKFIERGLFCKMDALVRFELVFSINNVTLAIHKYQVNNC